MQRVENVVLGKKNNIIGLGIDNITATTDCSQLTNKPTYFLYGNSFFRNSSNIDLTFSSNIGFTRYYGIKPSVFEEYRHNITYGTPDFNVHPLPPYYR